MRRLFEKLGVPVLEGNVLVVALVLAVGHLLLIAWAAIRLQINVPTCVVSDPTLLEPSFQQVEEDRYQVNVVASMWKFEPATIRVPVGTTLDVFLSSRDVIHGYFIKDTTLNLMAIPGAIGNAQIRFDEPGEYPVFCHEYCGSGHHLMMGNIEVVAGLETAVAVGIRSPGEAAPPEVAFSPMAEAGKAVSLKYGCVACHSLDGTKLVGPTFQGIWGREETLVDGTVITVDEDYLHESILQPNAKIVKGYLPNMMPPLPIPEEEVQQMIAYLREFSTQAK
ncbi:MAG: c-type cytochrome [Verrucomicrobiota bacterium]